MSRPKDILVELHDLLPAFCDGMLTQDQHDRLNAILRDSKQARQVYLDYADLHAALGDCRINRSCAPPAVAEIARLEEQQQALPGTASLLMEVIEQERTARIKREAEEALQRQQAEEEEKRRRASWARMMGIGQDKPVEVRKRMVIPTPVFYSGIAALLAIALWVGWSAVSSMMQDDPADFAETTLGPVEPEQPVVIDRPVVATLIRTLDAVWAERHVEVRTGEAHAPAPLTGGAELREGDRYTLTQGFAQLDTKRGAIVVLEAPCEIELLGENHVKLTRGRLVGECPTNRSRGFTVFSPNSRIVDIGTKFEIHVTGDQREEVTVYDGHVELSVRDSDESYRVVSRISENQHAEVLSDRTVRMSEVVELDLPNTGQHLRVGQSDPNWLVLARSDKPELGAWSAFVAAGERLSEWDTGTKYTSQWICVDDDSYLFPAGESATFQYSFDIPHDIKMDTVVIDVRFIVDDYLDVIRVNGKQVAIETPSRQSAVDAPPESWNYREFQTIQLKTGFQGGRNTIEWTIRNDAMRNEDQNPFGLRVEYKGQALRSTKFESNI